MSDTAFDTFRVDFLVVVKQGTSCLPGHSPGRGMISSLASQSRCPEVPSQKPRTSLSVLPCSQQKANHTASIKQHA